MPTRRRVVLFAGMALLGAALGFGGLLESCQPANRAPLARFSFTPTEPTVGETVTFDASSSRDPDGKIVSYLWDFGDGTTAQDVTTSHAFQQEGEYDVILQVMDDRGASSSLTKTIRVAPLNKLPMASFTVTPSEPMTNQPVTFDASASVDPDGTITAYTWEFGDQTTGQNKVVTHVYKTAGTYPVKLTVTDDKGAQSSATKEITVGESPPNEPPFAKFDFTPAVATVNEPVNFDAAESRDDGQIVKYEWDFGDGSSGEGQQVSHTYKTAGTFIVKLTVTDDLGATGSTTRSVLVRESAVVESFAVPGEEPSGLAWDGENFWLADLDSEKIYKLDKAGKLLSSFAAPGSTPTGLAWDGTNLWVADSFDGQIYKVNLQNGKVVGAFDLPNSDPQGLAWDGANFWVVDADTGKLEKLNSNGDLLESFDSPGDSPAGLTWDGKNLWMSDSDAGVIKIDPATGKQISTVKAPGPDPRGLAWDGTYLWVVDGETLKAYRVAP